MKKILSFILMFIFFIIPVKADVTTCDSFILISDLSFYNPTFFSNDGGTSRFYFPNNTSSNTTYYFKILTENTFDFSSNILKMNALPQNDNTSMGFNNSKLYSYNSSTGILQLTTMQGNSYDTKKNMLYYDGNVNVSSLEGAVVVFSTTLSDIENCELIPTTPPEPPTPPASTFFSDFLSVFTDRLSFLATSFTTEPALFCFIVIILAFIVLELFLKLIKGGRR